MATNWHASGIGSDAAVGVRPIMSQSILNSGRFQGSNDKTTSAAVSFLDKAPAKKAATAVKRHSVWPIVAVAFGGLATLAWNGFLLWHTARALIGWVSGDV